MVWAASIDNHQHRVLHEGDGEAQQSTVMRKRKTRKRPQWGIRFFLEGTAIVPCAKMVPVRTAGYVCEYISSQRMSERVQNVYSVTWFKDHNFTWERHMIESSIALQASALLAGRSMRRISQSHYLLIASFRAPVRLPWKEDRTAQNCCPLSCMGAVLRIQ